MTDHAAGSTIITALTDDPEFSDSWLHPSGATGINLVANAIQVWAIAQNREVTVNDAALAFNITPDIAHQAVYGHCWMFLTKGDVIEHEGE